MSLKQILEKINAIKGFASAEVPDEPRSTLGGRLSRKRNAEMELKTLYEQYRQELLRGSIFILVVGSERKGFMRSVIEQFQFFSADSNKFYKDLCGRIPEVLYKGRANGSNILDVVMRHFEDKALEIGMIGYPLVSFNNKYATTFKDKKDFLAMTKRIINEQVGGEVVGIQAAKDILLEAIEKGHDGLTTPIILQIDDDADLQAISSGLSRLTRRIYTVVAGSGEAYTYTDNSVIVPEVSNESAKYAVGLLRSLMRGKTIESFTVPVFESDVVVPKDVSPLDAALAFSDNNPVTPPELVTLAQADVEAAAIKSAENFGAPETIIFLDEESAGKFVEAMENPPAPTEALVEAVKKRRGRQPKPKTT